MYRNLLMVGQGQSPAIHREGPPKALVRLPSVKFKKCTIPLRSQGKYSTSPPDLPEADVQKTLAADDSGKILSGFCIGCITCC